MDRCHRVGPLASGLVSRLTPGRHVRTVKEPVQPIPLFEQLVALLMEPDNQHIILNVSTASRTAYRETG